MEWIPIVVIAVLALIVVISNIHIVQQSRAYVIERLGAFSKVWQVGMHVKVPFIERVAKKVSLKEQVLDYPPQPVITKDNVTMQIDTVVYYQITDPRLYTYGVERPMMAMETLTATTLRNIIGDLELDQCLTSRDIINSKTRQDFGITYDLEVLRLIDIFRKHNLKINSVVVTRYEDAPAVNMFINKLERRDIKTYKHFFTKGYPTDVETIVSEEGYGANPYIEVTKPLVVVTGPGGGSGKLATCLSQLYHEYKRGTKVRYAKFETFPIWNLSLKHPVNIAYEAATADLNDVNMIDPFHLEEYGQTAVNYNRDVEVFPVLSAMFERILGHSPYKSPTDMGVNMAGFCLSNDEV